MQQPTTAYQAISTTLKEKGEAGLLDMLKDEVECYYLDYKEVIDDFSESKTLRNYWDVLAKAISGFGNALGGVLIFGIKDKDKSLKPFLGYKNFEKLTNEFVSRSTNPRHERINSFSFPSKEDNDKGYVIIEIPQSQNRPLQVISNGNKHRYFYRSGESHEDMPHDVLVGMLGYKIPPILCYQWQYNSYKENVAYFEFDLILRNKGSVIAKDVWLNNSLNIPNTNVLHTNFKDQFEGAILDNSCSLITKNTYRLPPEGMISMLKIQMPKKELINSFEYYFYFSFGCDGSKINTFNAKFTGSEFNELKISKTEELILFLKNKSPNHITERF